MYIALINLTLTLIKLLAFNWFTAEQTFFKSFLIILLIFTLYGLYKYSKTLPLDLHVIVKYYKIHNMFELILSFSVIVLYIGVFVGGMFYLRFLNINRTLDLNALWLRIYSSLLNHDLVTNFVNIITLILLILTYIIILSKLIKLFKRHFVKLHIYYSRFDNEWYGFTFPFKYFPVISYQRYLYKVYSSSAKIFNKRVLSFPFHYHVTILTQNIHYLILIATILYDIRYNNLILCHIYNIFPYIFVYDLYIKFCDLVESRIEAKWECDYDLILHDYIYVEEVHLLTEKEVFLDGRLYEIEYIQNSIFIYLKNGLNVELMSQIMGNNFYANKCWKYNYYKDWGKNISRY